MIFKNKGKQENAEQQRKLEQKKGACQENRIHAPF
jgi:hypothetical protein